MGSQILDLENPDGDLKGCADSSSCVLTSRMGGLNPCVLVGKSARPGVCCIMTTYLMSSELIDWAGFYVRARDLFALQYSFKIIKGQGLTSGLDGSCCSRIDATWCGDHFA